MSKKIHDFDLKIGVSFNNYYEIASNLSSKLKPMIHDLPRGLPIWLYVKLTPVFLSGNKKKINATLFRLCCFQFVLSAIK